MTKASLVAGRGFRSAAPASGASLSAQLVAKYEALLYAIAILEDRVSLLEALCNSTFSSLIRVENEELPQAPDEAKVDKNLLHWYAVGTHAVEMARSVLNHLDRSLVSVAIETVHHREPDSWTDVVSMPHYVSLMNISLNSLLTALEANFTTCHLEEESGWDFSLWVSSVKKLRTVVAPPAVVILSDAFHPAIQHGVTADATVPLLFPTAKLSPGFLREWLPVLRFRKHNPVPGCRDYLPGNTNYQWEPDYELPFLAIVTVAVTPKDHRGSWLPRLSYLNKNAYADRWGIDLIVEDDRLFRSSRSPKWAKITALKKWIVHYQYVFWMDMDAFFMNFEFPLQNLIDVDYDVVFARDWNGINNGVVMFRNSPFTVKLLNDMWDVPSKEWAPFQDQGALLYLLDPTRCPTANATWLHMKTVPQRWFNSYPYEFAVGHDSAAYQDGDFIAHFPDCANIDTCRATATTLFWNAVQNNRVAYDLVSELVKLPSALHPGDPFWTCERSLCRRFRRLPTADDPGPRATVIRLRATKPVSVASLTSDAAVANRSSSEGDLAPLVAWEAHVDVENPKFLQEREFWHDLRPIHTFDQRQDQLKQLLPLLAAFETYRLNRTALVSIPVLVLTCQSHKECRAITAQIVALEGIAIGHLILVASGSGFVIGRDMENWVPYFPSRLTVIARPEIVGQAEAWNAALRMGFSIVPTPRFVWINKPGMILRKGAAAQFSAAMREFTGANHTGIASCSFYGSESFAVTLNGWRKIGSFDENMFPAYAEDVDYLLRQAAIGMKSCEYATPPLFDTIKIEMEVSFASMLRRWNREAYMQQKWNVQLSRPLGQQHAWRHPFNFNRIPDRHGWVFDASHRECILKGTGECRFNMTLITALTAVEAEKKKQTAAEAEKEKQAEAQAEQEKQAEAQAEKEKQAEAQAEKKKQIEAEAEKGKRVAA